MSILMTGTLLGGHAIPDWWSWGWWRDKYGSSRIYHSDTTWSVDAFWIMESTYLAL